MKKKFNIKVVLVLSLTLFVWACTQNFEETNTNPNSPTEVPVTNNLGGVIYSFGSGFMAPGNSAAQHANYIGSRLQLATQTYQSIGEEWGGYYGPLTNINSIITASETAGNTNMQAVALTFRAQMTHIATDYWRDMPYTEACKAAEGNIAPAYDTQEEIYTFIIADLKKAADLFKTGGTDAIGAGDILLNGDVQKWRKYCNSLRLRVAIRISDVDQAASVAIINEVLDNPTDYPVLESNDDNAELAWPGTSPWEEAYWYWWYCCHHDGAGKVLVDIMNGFTDPRLPIWFMPATTDGKFRGSELVGYNASVNTREDISDYNPVFVSGNPSPTGLNEYGVKDGFFRYSEVCFLKAEIFNRGLKTGNAQEEYEKGIEASMTQWGVADADITTYMTNVGVAWEGTADDLTKIYTQKYLALYLMANEGWAEARRTDVPVLPLASNSTYPDHNRAPFRLPYPQTEQALNSKNCEEFLGNVDDFFWGQQMWWDTRSGVN
jgi:hypothetical protein